MADESNDLTQQIAIPKGSAEAPLIAIGLLELISGAIQDRYEMDPKILVKNIELNLAGGSATISYDKQA